MNITEAVKNETIFDHFAFGAEIIFPLTRVKNLWEIFPAELDFWAKSKRIKIRKFFASQTQFSARAHFLLNFFYAGFILKYEAETRNWRCFEEQNVNKIMGEESQNMITNYSWSVFRRSSVIFELFIIPGL